MISNNKKRKHEEIDESLSINNNKIQEEDDDEVLFSEMTIVNNYLLSLSERVKRVDHHYFVKRNNMIDEFIGNINEFVKQLDDHRKKLSSEQLNSDTLFHVFQFLQLRDLLSCGFVSHQWREAFQRVDLKLRARQFNIEELLTGVYVKQISSLKLGSGVAVLKELAQCKKLGNLRSLDLSGNDLGIQSIRNLNKCSLNSLTELNLFNVNKFDVKCATSLFNGPLVSGLKKLTVSLDNDSIDICKIIADSDKLDGLTSLNIELSFQGVIPVPSGIDYGLGDLLRNKKCLESLNISKHSLLFYPKLFEDVNCINLKHLDLSQCRMKNQDFVNLIVNLPNLTSVIAEKLNSSRMYGENEDKEVVRCPPNSTSSVTSLNLQRCFITSFPTLTQHCPNLKKLDISLKYIEEKDLPSYVTFLSATALANLEQLDISYCGSLRSLLEIVCKLPIYGNLKKLFINNHEDLDSDLITSCTNLVNLEEIHGRGIKRECMQAFKTNPTFSKLKIIRFDLFTKYLNSISN